MFQPNLIMEAQVHQVENADSDGEDIIARTLREFEEFENQSGIDNQDAAFGDDQARGEGNCHRRHTQHQIRAMEAFFKDCPHPDNRQRKELGRQLGLEPLQVKFWFQNKRTQMKSNLERSENSQLRSENEKLRSDNMKYKETLNNASCTNCRGPAVGEMSFEAHHLSLENSHLRQEINRISTILAANHVGDVGHNPQTSYPLIPPPVISQPAEIGFDQDTSGVEMLEAVDTFRSIRVPISDADKPIVIEVAVGAMEELIKMAQMGAPLWIAGGIDGSTTELNKKEYFKAFGGLLSTRPTGFKCEASRESAIVLMNQTNLVQILMNVNKWPILFAGVVSKAMTVEVLSTGVAGSLNGTIQVMTAEFQMPSPFVPTRESYFVRYCKQHVDGLWAVVDVSLENLIPGSLTKFRRRPSGCLIQEMPNGFSKVTWVEHVEVETDGVNNLYKPLVHSGLAFGANRWIATLDRQCRRLAGAMAAPSSDFTYNSVITNPEGRMGMLKVAERMVLSLLSGFGASTANVWTVISGTADDDIRVMTRKIIGRPSDVVLNAATSFWLHVPPNMIFDFLCNNSTRNQWDSLSTAGVIEEMAHIPVGPHPGNSVSLLHVHNSNVLILQECLSDPTGSYMIFAPVDISAMNNVLGGGNPANVALQPSGFAILPDGPISDSKKVRIDGESGSGGSLVTVAFQVQVGTDSNTMISSGSVSSIKNLATCTVAKIKAALVGENA